MVPRLCLAPFAALLSFAVAAQQPTPPVAETAAAGAPVAARVHEPLELLCIAARFAGLPEYQPRRPEPAYCAAVAAHFASGKEHALVVRLRELRNAHGISYDAVASLAVHLDASLTPRTPLVPRPPMLDARWQDADAPGVVALLAEFARATDAATFFAGRREFYAEVERRLAAQLAESKALPWFDTFFGARAGASCVAIAGLQCGGHNYGVSVQHTDGRPDELRPVFGCHQFDGEGVPRFTRTLLPLFVHELCHSYTNPLVEAHAERLRAAGERLFAAKAPQMRRQAYANGRTVLAETFVRMCVIRCMYDTEGDAAGKRQEVAETRDHFPWTIELAALLALYQQDRTKYPTFAAFVPVLAEHLDRIAAELAIPAAAPVLVAMTPANGSDAVDPACTELVFTFDRPMRDQSWSVVGSPQDTPKVTGKPSYDRERKVLTLPVALEPGRAYRFWLNQGSKQGFVSADGVALESVEVRLQTRRE